MPRATFAESSKVASTSTTPTNLSSPPSPAANSANPTHSLSCAFLCKTSACNIPFSGLCAESCGPNCSPESFQPSPTTQLERAATTMISDNQLYSLAIFLGSAAMLLIILYHFLEVNSEDHVPAEKPKAAAGKVKS